MLPTGLPSMLFERNARALIVRTRPNWARCRTASRSCSAGDDSVDQEESASVQPICRNSGTPRSPIFCLASQRGYGRSNGTSARTSLKASLTARSGPQSGPRTRPESSWPSPSARPSCSCWTATRPTPVDSAGRPSATYGSTSGLIHRRASITASGVTMQASRESIFIARTLNEPSRHYPSGERSLCPSDQSRPVTRRPSARSQGASVCPMWAPAL
jgi:hypothetical protein